MYPLTLPIFVFLYNFRNFSIATKLLPVCAGAKQQKVIFLTFSWFYGIFFLMSTLAHKSTKRNSTIPSNYQTRFKEFNKIALTLTVCTDLTTPYHHFIPIHCTQDSYLHLLKPNTNCPKTF
jgi:hypothetical protein